MALPAHGHPRTTIDLDVIAAWTPENLRRLAGALRELDAELRSVDADLLGLDLGDPQTLYGGGNFLMHTRHGHLDVFAVEQTVDPRSCVRAGIVLPGWGVAACVRKQKSHPAPPTAARLPLLRGTRSQVSFV